MKNNIKEFIDQLPPEYDEFIAFITNIRVQNERLQKTLNYERPDKYPDNCEICKGANAGVRGNENIVNGKVVCDYCS